MLQDCVFTFHPVVPTVEAFKNKAFPNYISIHEFFSDLKARELVYFGYIYFKGPYENYNDGTSGFYNNPKWWETGARSCVNGCCRVPLEKGYVIGTVRHKPERKYFARNWLEFKNIEDLEKLFNNIKDKDGILQIYFTEYGYFTVSARC